MFNEQLSRNTKPCHEKELGVKCTLVLNLIIPGS